VKDFKENHYTVISNVTNYINKSNELSRAEKEMVFGKSIKFMAFLARAIMLSIKKSECRVPDLSQVSADTDLGMWAKYSHADVFEKKNV
jgi:hypothetical protein